MVATTAVQAIRYPQLADAPCDWDLHMQQMASDMDARYAAHDADLARTLTTVPLMMLRLSLPTYLENTQTTGTTPSVTSPTGGLGTSIPWDTLEKQQGGLFVQLSVNPYVFRMPRVGYYQVGMSYQFAVGTDSDDFIAPLLTSQYAVNLVQFPQTLTQIRTQQRDRTFSLEPDVPGEEGSLTGMLRVTSTSTYFFWMAQIVGNSGPLLLDDPAYQIYSARAYAFWVADL